MLRIDFVRWDPRDLPPENDEVFRHYYRVYGADCLRRAREYASNAEFKQADEELRNGIIVLEDSKYLGYDLVQAVLRDLHEARALVQSDKTWDRGGEAHFASISYSHFSQAATAKTPQYANKQQKSPMPSIREEADS